METFDAVVVGAGPAGCACAVQLARQGATVAVVERGQVGGAVRNAYRVDNYPGFPGGVAGPLLAERIASQLTGWDVRLVRDSAVSAKRAGNGWIVATAGAGSLTGRALVVATGSVPRRPDWPGLPASSSGRVFFEVTEMPETLDDRHVAVIGAGDVGFDYALTLSARGARVDILARGRPRCVHSLSRKVEADPRIRLLRVGRVSGLRMVENGGIEPLCEHGGTPIGYDAVMIAMGREAENRLFREAEASPGTAEGLYLIGDAAHIEFRQVSCAVGDGVRAAMEIERWLRE